jgi:biotin carboxylase
MTPAGAGAGTSAEGPTGAPGAPGAPEPRVLLLVPARTYRAADFLLAAARLGLDLVIGSDGALPLGGRPVIPVNPADPDASTRRVLARAGTVTAVVAADTPMLMLAAAIAEQMGLPHSPPEAVRNATDKSRQRQRWAAAGVPQPRFEIVPAAAGAGTIHRAAETVGFPCVVKAISLSASQGILRADEPATAVTAAARIRRVLAAAGRPDPEPLLVEEYLPGPELSIDGLLAGDSLTVTAIFDKPAMPDGPTFEETLLLTPSQLPGPVLAAAIGTTGQAARALGLTHGPVHAELRIDERGALASPAMLELAARSIGGLCSRALRFPGGTTLEELILASALGKPVPAAGHDMARPAGVYMLPVPRPGVLRAVEGRDRAAAVPGITGLSITIPVGQRVRPLPDGDRYLGFIFAEAAARHEVEQALTAARDELRVIIE